MPITPHFSIDQTETHVLITIRVPHVRVSPESVHVVLTDDHRCLHFASPPYLLVLTFPHAFQENAEDACAQYRPLEENGTIVLTLAKQEPEVHWEQQDLVGALLRPRLNKSDVMAAIGGGDIPTTNGAAPKSAWIQEIVEDIVHNENNDDNDDGVPVNNDLFITSAGPAQQQRRQHDNDHSNNPLEVRKKRHTFAGYGFARMFHDIFTDLVRDGLAREMLERPLVENFAGNNALRVMDASFDEADENLKQLLQQRLEMEAAKFSAERYLQDIDVHDDYLYQCAMQMLPHWSTIGHTRQGGTEDCQLTTAFLEKTIERFSGLELQGSPIPKTIHDQPSSTTTTATPIFFTREESAQLVSIPYPLLPPSLELQQQSSSLLLGLLDLLFAYVYDHLITNGEPTVESAWTCSILSTSLSWLDSFDDNRAMKVDSVFVQSLRRALIYPYLRNLKFAMYVWKQVEMILRKGRRCILRCLLQLRTILEQSELYYLGNKLYVDPYLAWLQQPANHHQNATSSNTMEESLDKQLVQAANQLEQVLLLDFETIKDMVGLNVRQIELKTFERLEEEDSETKENSSSDSDDSVTGGTESGSDESSCCASSKGTDAKVTVASHGHGIDVKGEPVPTKGATNNDDDATIQHHRVSARWAILRNAIMKRQNPRSTKLCAAFNGSIHRFAGFGLLQRQRLPRAKVKPLIERLTKIRLPVIAAPDFSRSYGNSGNYSDWNDALVEELKVSLMALSALRPDRWIWDFDISWQCDDPMVKQYAYEEGSTIVSMLDERLVSGSGGGDDTGSSSKHHLRLGHGSGWMQKSCSSAAAAEAREHAFRVVLAPYYPSYGIFQYTLPFCENKTDNDGLEISPPPDVVNGNHQFLWTRERLESAPTSLQELMTHHHHQGVDNTGNICVWDSEQTLAYCMVKLVAEHAKEWLSLRRDNACFDILELGSGMAGLSGLALAAILQRQAEQPPVRLWLTDGHPTAIENNLVNVRLAKALECPALPQPIVSCLVLPWSTEPPVISGETQPLGCHVALVSDCTHFQEFHAHLFLTLAYRVRVGGSVYMCQPHRGKSLKRFLELIQITDGHAISTKSLSVKDDNDDCNSSTDHSNTSRPIVGAETNEVAMDDEPLFGLEWLQINELSTQGADQTTSSDENYDPDIHCPHWIVLRKLREVHPADRAVVLKHIGTRKNACGSPSEETGKHSSELLDSNIGHESRLAKLKSLTLSPNSAVNEHLTSYVGARTAPLIEEM